MCKKYYLLGNVIFQNVQNLHKTQLCYSNTTESSIYKIIFIIQYAVCDYLGVTIHTKILQVKGQGHTISNDIEEYIKAGHSANEKQLQKMV